MRIKLITIVSLLLCLTLAGSVACSPFGGEEEVEQQLVEVVRGDLVISVSGSGYIEVSKEANLAFDVGGRIAKIYVDEGDSVSQGDVLAKLETDALELALTQAQVALTKAEVAVTSANVTLRTAKHSLEEARDIYTWPEIKEMQEDVDEAKAYVDYVSTNLAEASTAAKEAMWTSALAYAQARLAAAEAKLDARINSYDTEEVAIKKMEVELAKQSLQLAQQSLKQAQQSLQQAQKNLDEATLTAPFDGVVAAVHAKEGDVIPSPTMAPTIIINLVDFTTMELTVEVDELDIPEVKPGQRTVISVDALPDVNLEGEVVSISPLPKKEAGLVLYEVKTSFAVPEGSGLRVGMSATADIIIDERSNVLLVPDRAIKQDAQGNPVVEVMLDEQTEERPVVLGVSDGFHTEIIAGLKEGDMVVIKTKAKSAESGGSLF